MVFDELVSTRFTGRQRSWTRELPRGCHVSGGLGVGRANKAQSRRGSAEEEEDGGEGRGKWCGLGGTHEYWVSQAVLLGGGEQGEESGRGRKKWWSS